MSKRRLFDEESGREVPAGTTVSVTIRYQVRELVCVARLLMTSVTDFSLFEQEGADCSSLDVIQAEYNAGKLRFWFDPQGELYIVCEEAELEEVSTPIIGAHHIAELACWTFQGEAADGPTVQWLLEELDRAGMPCTWRTSKRTMTVHPTIQWEGDLIPTGDGWSTQTNMVHVMAYRLTESQGFGLVLQVLGTKDRQICRILEVLADHITQYFPGNCLVGTIIIPGREWKSWLAQEGRTALGGK